MNIRASVLPLAAIAAAAMFVLVGTCSADARLQPIPFSTIARGPYGDWSKPALIAARNPREWDRVMAALAARGELIAMGLPDAPTIDWTHQIVVLVALGRADGYAVEVRGVQRSGESLVLDVHVEQTQPTGGVDVSPFHLLAITAKGMRSIEAHYDFALPGLPTSTSLRSSGAVGPSSAGVKGPETTEVEVVPGPERGQLAAQPAALAAEAPAPVSASWGTLKRLYR